MKTLNERQLDFGKKLNEEFAKLKRENKKTFQGSQVIHAAAPNSSIW